MELLAEYQARLAAQDTWGMLVCLQALDAAGKDGTIRHVMSGVNPQGVQVSSFKVPSAEELDHDYLWRYAQRLPGRGEIGIFNRSHYEEVLVVRVHPEILAQQASRRPEGQGDLGAPLREINDWERFLVENGFKVVKLFLNLSKEEQRMRFLRRVDLPDKNWKFSTDDARERAVLGRLPGRVLGDAVAHQHGVGAVVRDPGGPQVVRPDLRVGDPGAHPDRDRSAVPDGRCGQAAGPGRDEGAAGGRGARGAAPDPVRAEIVAKAGRSRLPRKASRPARTTSASSGSWRSWPRRSSPSGRRVAGSPGCEGNEVMAISDQVQAPEGPAVAAWYALSAEEVTTRLGVDPATGLSAARAAELLAKNGPNALPVEQPPPAIRRLLAEYTSYMQIILVGAAIVSLVIQQWATAIVLFVITLFNALVGLRQAGKAESAMNALQSMMKATARVRRDGTEAQIPAEQVVVGDVVLISAGDEVPADGRIVTSSALQIDESALTGESVPAAKDAETLSGGEVGPGEQSNMAFMHTPVTHGSAVVVVTGTGSDTQVGKIAHMLSATAKEETPLTRQMNTLTLWIVGAAGLTMIVMFALGLSRGQGWKMLFDTAVALAIAAIPLALPMVVQVVLSLGSVELAKEKAIVKDLPSVETLGFTSAINSDKTGTLTMNQMTAVEVVDPTDRYAITGIGYSLEGKISHPAGRADTIDAAILPYVVASDTKLVDGTVVGDPTEGALLVLAHKAGVFIDGTREQLPRLATLPFDPSYKLMATFNQAKDASGREVVRCFVKGAAPAVMARAATALANGTSVAWDDTLRPACRAAHAADGRGGPAGHGRRLPRPRSRQLRPGR